MNDSAARPNSFSITANCVDVVAGQIAAATVHVADGRIATITPNPSTAASGYLIPGFVDAHIHIESSLLPPSTFATAALPHGTIATVSDPHEIANVCGVAGIQYMLDDAQRSPLKFHFGVPSCVPATRFETAGANLDADDVARLLDHPQLNYLAEVMNYPAVIAAQPEMLAKIQAAMTRGLPIDGHAPGVRGPDLQRYLDAGISTDHECTTLAEAEEKIQAGCRIAIREGSAARNFDALWPLLKSSPEACFLCSDDKHPDALTAGHINRLVQRAVQLGCEPMDVLRAASLNPIRHYGLPVGLLQVGDPADFLLVDNLQDFTVQRCYVDGVEVAANGRPLFQRPAAKYINNFNIGPIQPQLLQQPVRDKRNSDKGVRIRVIQVHDGQLLTSQSIQPARIVDNAVVGDMEADILKLVVVNRYEQQPPAVGFVRGFGLQHAALASSVAHDSHNLVAVGTSDELLTAALNAVIDARGGLSIASPNGGSILPLPIAGLMSDLDATTVTRQYTDLNQAARQAGCGLEAPFMTLSFLSLLVIPDLKLGDHGLFDVQCFQHVDLFQ